MQFFVTFSVRFFAAVLGLVCLYFLSACQPPKDSKTYFPADFNPAYSLYLIYEDGEMGFLVADSLWQKSYTVPVPYPQFTREFIHRKGFFYHVNPQNNYLIQSKLSPEGLRSLDSIPLVNNNIESFAWKNDTDTLLLLNVQKGDRDSCWFYEIDTKPFAFVRKQHVPIPSAVEDYNLLSIGLSRFQHNELWIAYTYSKFVGMHDYTTVDTMYYATFDFQTLTQKKIQKDSRSAYPGGINTVQSYDMELKNGDYYFMSCPGIALGNAPDMPTAVFRRENGQDMVDTQYMLNISEHIGNHAYGLWQVADNQVVIRSERKDKYDDFANHHAVYQFDYYLVDLIKESLEHLDLPLDKGTRKENVLVRDGKMYIGIDDEQNRHLVWQYEISTGKISPVFESVKNTSYILRIDWLGMD